MSRLVGERGLRTEVRELMEDEAVRAKYPEGLTAGEVLNELAARDVDTFPLSTLDVANFMRSYYGGGSR